ncbi:iron-containing alcohol dehydrogenase [Thioalkalivibrio sp.]|uniref:iron-containing alcohol dehydrogenase n=1 Tax=Thioalkalivibrio sp. TaxID=2093813 RepID=UPI003976D0BE
MAMDFAIARLPRIEFGAGVRHRLPALAAGFGRRVLLVTGGRSLLQGPLWPELEAGFAAAGLDVIGHRVSGEPSPEAIDAAVQRYRDRNVSVVVAIGGGSALDAGKAIAGLLLPGNPVLDHLEGVGPERPYDGPALPFIAAPTTAGTGSEATRNAVLSTHGEGAYKKSFRDERLVADYAVVDPDFLATCPPAVIAGNGMDALTQLLESYLSLRANPFCDALALDGLAHARDSLLGLYRDPGDAAARAGMAYASLLSGITLAQTGLGSVHGLAAPLGAFFPVPHGVACGTLVAAATAVNISALSAREPGHPALARYAVVGRLLTGRAYPDDGEARAALVALLEAWTGQLDLPALDHFGITIGDHPRIVANSRGSSMKTNPIVLEDSEISAILEARQSASGPG